MTSSSGVGGAPVTGQEADEWVPLSHRYGLHDHQLGESIIGSRHGKVYSHNRPTQCEPDPRLTCACPGGPISRDCCQRATAEDRLCDACRKWCWAIDSADNYHRLIDLPVVSGAHRGR